MNLAFEIIHVLFFVPEDLFEQRARHIVAHFGGLLDGRKFGLQSFS